MQEYKNEVARVYKGGRGMAEYNITDKGNGKIEIEEAPGCGTKIFNVLFWFIALLILAKCVAF